MSEETAAAAPTVPHTPEGSAVPKRSADPMQESVLLGEQSRRWRLRFYASCFAFGFLFVVSIVQFMGTFLTCRMLHETRQEIEKLRSDGVLRELQKARETADEITHRSKELRILEEEVLIAKADLQER